MFTIAWEPGIEVSLFCILMCIAFVINLSDRENDTGGFLDNVLMESHCAVFFADEQNALCDCPSVFALIPPL